MGTAVSGGAIVTGSASGIGREIATTLAKDGFGIVIADLNEAMGAEVVNHIKAEGGQAIFHKVRRRGLPQGLRFGEGDDQQCGLQQAGALSRGQ